MRFSSGLIMATTAALAVVSALPAALVADLALPILEPREELVVADKEKYDRRHESRDELVVADKEKYD
ncbi:hypothetical protein O9K51_08671 [Purpureocillium lavendulum]|uniref:Uncharacterized protein n=1 Tax=Purpureocillium lavendulum TaxID=1247861 RepID=A0AB34FGA3_9HYPO|nr:hypothetical protein O9K51_08671 [Purpureocillium lavendulum]